MRAYLTKEAYQQVCMAIDKGGQIDRKVADHVAASMRDWALSKQATHYTHWFQPLTGATAEKHDAFFDLNFGWELPSKILMAHSSLNKNDASSFPSGGIRNTFEARGYTFGTQLHQLLFTEQPCVSLPFLCPIRGKP